MDKAPDDAAAHGPCREAITKHEIMLRIVILPPQLFIAYAMAGHTFFNIPDPIPDGAACSGPPSFARSESASQLA